MENAGLDTMRLLTLSFDHEYVYVGRCLKIASQDVDIVRLEEVVAKDQPEELWPGDDCGKEALHSVVAGTVATPASNAGHGDTAGHGQEGQGDAAQLAYRSRRQT